MTRKTVCVRNSIFLLVFAGLVLTCVACSVDQSSDIKKALCEANLGKIRIALSSCFMKTAQSSPSAEPSFPSSLHDANFQANFFEDGKLPEHPCGKDWDNFYNSTDGKLDMKAACTCK